MKMHHKTKECPATYSQLLSPILDNYWYFAVSLGNMAVKHSPLEYLE